MTPIKSKTCRWHLLRHLPKRCRSDARGQPAEWWRCSADATFWTLDVQTKAQLQHRVDLVVAEREQIKALVAQGKTLAEVEAAVGDPPPGQEKPGSNGPRFVPFAEVVYQELTEAKH